MGQREDFSALSKKIQKPAYPLLTHLAFFVVVIDGTCHERLLSHG
jgi:hypothetical protein